MPSLRPLSKFLLASTLLLALPLTALAQDSAQWDTISKDVLRQTGVPSASLAVVRDGHIVYKRAYGLAQAPEKILSEPSMRYSIGSISKQFTAAAILLLQERGKLSLDDKVEKWIPGLTAGDRITIRQLLSHTAGYRDDWPQDYVMPPVMKPITPQQILDGYAKIPLEFEPGTKWQYSNTNYTIAGLIAEKASGMPLMDFLRQNIFEPLGMKSVYNTDEAALPASDAIGYVRYALGPLHPAPKEGTGWMFAAGELAMTAEDLARWNLAMINQQLLKPESWKAMQTDVLLADGTATGYGLGVEVGRRNGHRFVAHSGEVSGFVAENIVFPDDHAAVVVLTNQDASAAASQIGWKIGESFFTPAQSADTQTARKVFEGLQHGKIDRALFTDNCNAYFDETTLRDYSASLGGLGKVQDFTLMHESLRGGMTHRSYRVKLEGRSVAINAYVLPNGKIEQFIVTPVD